MVAAIETDRCAVEGCLRARKPNGMGQRARWCSTHVSRKHRNGDVRASEPVIPNGEWHHDHPSYATAHKRVRARRGVASTHECPCGAPAAEWSYEHLTGGPELTEVRAAFGRTLIVRYSSNPADYVPRCLSCHRSITFQNRKDQ